MSELSDEEVGGVLYTALLQIYKPCYASEICEKEPGLKKHQDKVVELLQRMCDSGIVVYNNGKYILKEKNKSDLDEDTGQLSYDGPTHGCSTNQAADIVRSAPMLATRGAVVPVQQTTVQRSSTTDFSCDSAALELYTGHLTKIVAYLRGFSGSVKAKDIAQGTGIGKSRSDVNRCLYFLKQHDIVQDNEKKEWTFMKDVQGDDLTVLAAKLAKIPLGKSKGKQPAALGSSNNVCDCPNAGPGCQHNTYNFQQNIHHHHQNIQVGDGTRMYTGLPPDGATGGGHQ